MATTKAPKSLAEQLADLENPAPKDFDPEDNAEHIDDDDGSSSSGDDEDPAGARGHYVDVGKSKLRKPNGINLGPQYKGSSVSRDVLLAAESENDPFGGQSEQQEFESSDYADPEEDQGLQGMDDDEEIDSDEAFESGDDKKFEGYTFRGSRPTRQDPEEGASQDEEAGVSDVGSEDIELQNLNGSESGSEDEDDAQEQDSGIDMNDAEDAPIEDSDDPSISDEATGPKADDRAALRRMMAEEQKTVAASLSKAAKEDLVKGRAIKHQRTTFDALLNTRIKLQKALISTNSMSAASDISSEHTEAIRVAESAALTLWTNISSLRSSLQATNPKKRPFSATDTPTSSALWTEMQLQDSSSLPNRRAILTKWSQKTNPAVALTRINKFSQTPSQQPLTSVLDQHLSGSNLDKLMQKTRVPRSCAPLQATARVALDPSIYDDADFYTLLLRELVDQRMADSNAPISNGATNLLPSLPSQKDFKVKRVVDTKASKGRKMRYTVHEKLQNFMAPDDRGTWGERQRGELFGSLLGRKISMVEDDEVESEGVGETNGEMNGVEGGLRLFG